MILKRYLLVLMAALAVFACSPGVDLDDNTDDPQEQNDPQDDGTDDFGDDNGNTSDDNGGGGDDNGGDNGGDGNGGTGEDNGSGEGGEGGEGGGENGGGDDNGGEGGEQQASQPGWFELPKMNIARDGKYMVNSSDDSQYYAWHICPDFKGPNGNNARNYTVCFSAEYHCPLWIAAPLHTCYQASGRHEAYGPDPDIPEDCQWKGSSNASGYNKGHMLGSADRNITTKTNNQVFYYSNIAPQLNYDKNEGGGFNTGGGGWNTLEDWIDTKWVKNQTDTLFAVIGCYFKPFGDVYHSGTMVNTELLSGWGRSDVAKPTMFYYAVLRVKKSASGKAVKDCSANELQCAVFARAHVRNLHGQKVTAKEMMSVSDLEALTGVSYFTNIPQAPKDSFTASDWGL